MQIFYFDAFGALTGEGEARESPREPDVFLIPAGATDVVPPAFGGGEIPVFSNGAWAVLEDHRGETVYDTNTQESREVEEPGPIPVGETLVAPTDLEEAWDGAAWVLPPEVRLDRARRQRIQEVRELGLERIQARIGAIDSLEMVELLRILWPVLVDPASQPTLAAARDIFLYAKGKIVEIRGMTQTQVDAYDPTTDGNFPS